MRSLNLRSRSSATASILASMSQISRRMFASDDNTSTASAPLPPPSSTSSPTAVTASGTRVYDGLLACPRKYPFGTLFAIEGRVYECRDRLSRKYDECFDLWKPTNKAARLFGKRKLLIVALIPISRYASVIRDWLHVRLRRY